VFPAKYWYIYFICIICQGKIFCRKQEDLQLIHLWSSPALQIWVEIFINTKNSMDNQAALGGSESMGCKVCQLIITKFTGG